MRKRSCEATPRIMVVWCWDWPIVAAGISPDEPGAVFHANRVIASSAAARKVGVTRGLRRREAQGRCPELIIVDRDRDGEVRSFEAVASAIEAFSPRLELTQPGTCLLTTHGPSRYFGGDSKLADLVLEAVGKALDGRTTCSIGIADGVFPARIAARARGDAARIVSPGASADFLAPLAITLLDIPDLTNVLWRLGIRTLGEFAALDPADVLGRFGREGVAAHAQAGGRDGEHLDAVDPPQDMAVSISFDPPVDRIDRAAFAARRLALALSERLEARGAACSRVTVEAESEHGERYVRGWRHEGALSVGALTDRVRWQLDAWLSTGPSIRPSGGLSSLTLRPENLLPASGRQLGFWGGETEADLRAGRVAARLEALLGAENVQIAEWRGGREPDDAIRFLPATSIDLAERHISAVDVRPWPGRLDTPSPTELFFKVSIEVVDERGEPVLVSGRGELTGRPARMKRDGRSWKSVVAWAGPWLLDEHWWDPDRARRRARFQLVDEDGEALLVHVESGAWWLAGAY